MSTTTQYDGSHTIPDRLEDQAASAALFVTRDKSSKQNAHSVLDEDGKLSSAGAATSLKHARAQDLPSFPSQGGVKLSSAGAAASLADSNKRSFEHWKPGAIPAANKAAMLAKDYEMDPLWQPEMSKAGSKAALLASRDTASADVWRAPESVHGRSAAGQALGVKQPNAITERNTPPDDHRKALLAATGAMSGSRRRAGSAPIKPQSNSAGWALKAATSSHNAQSSPQSTEFTTGDPGFEAARIQNIAKGTVPRQMYGSAPPVSVEVEDKNRQAMLKASAVAMAQKMYAIQQSHIDEAKNTKRSDSHYGATAARNRALSDISSTANSETKASPRYENLEEAARKLAQERLSKIHDEHAEYRQYYGATTTPPRSRLSMRHRRRTSSMGRAEDSDDEEQSRKIRSQMSIFQSKLAEVDNKKRQADRDALLQAAHKNVTARMNAMDEKVFQDTGKASPQQREIWERQARERAQRDSDERMINVGKVHIGGGKYLDQAEVDAIARARLQPTLDEISDKAEKQRARDEEIRLEQERQKDEAAKEKARLAEIKAEAKAANEQGKLEERTRRAEDKRIQKEEAAAAKNKRTLEAAAEKERLRQEKEEKRKSKDSKPGRVSTILGKGATGAAVGTSAVAATAGTETLDEAPPHTGGTNESELPEPIEGETAHDQVTTTPFEDANAKQEVAEPSYFKDEVPAASDAKAETEDKAPLESRPRDEEKMPATENLGEISTSPSKGDSKVKSWFKSRFRSSSKAQTDGEGKPDLPDSVPSATAAKSSPSDDMPRPNSMRDVALAGRTTTRESEDMYSGPSADAPISPLKDAPEGHGPALVNHSPSISSLSSNEPPKVSTEQPASESVESDSEIRGRKGFKQRLLSKVKPDKSKESEADAKPNLEKSNTAPGGEDDFEEARDTFEEKKLAPPPKLSSATAASPRGSRERSKFKEDL